MVDPALLAILCCPETHQPLTVAPAEVVESLNAKIVGGALKNRAGEALHEPIDGALIREDRKVLYVVRKGIPVMLIDQAISAN